MNTSTRRWLTCEPCPPKHAQRPQGVPAARLPGLLQFEKHLSRIAFRKKPHAVGLPAGADKFDGVRQARVVLCVRRAEVVEAAQHVVVPARWKMEAREICPSDLAGTVAAKQAVQEQKLLGAGTGVRTRRPAEQRFQRQYGGVERTVGRPAEPRSGAAVPATVGHLCR